MRNKLWAGIAALAIGIGVASCGENEEPASKQSSSKAPEAQQTPSTQAEQPGAEKQAKQSAPAEPEGQPSGQTASPAPAGQEKQPESGQQEQRPQVAQQEQQLSTTQGQPSQQNTSAPQSLGSEPDWASSRAATAEPAETEPAGHRYAGCRPTEFDPRTASTGAGTPKGERIRRRRRGRSFGPAYPKGGDGLPAATGIRTERTNRSADRYRAWSLDCEHQRTQRHWSPITQPWTHKAATVKEIIGHLRSQVTDGSIRAKVSFVTKLHDRLRLYAQQTIGHSNHP